MNIEKTRQEYWREDTAICVDACKDASHVGPVNPSIVMSSFFSFDSHDAFSEALKDQCSNTVYSRGNNPTVRVLEEKLAKLERGEMARCFASGMGAITGTLFALLKTGDHVIAINNIYDKTIEYLNYREAHQISLTHLKSEFSIQALSAAILPHTKLIYIESPASTTFEQVDILAITSLAKQHGILVMMDNTWATPLFQKPLLLGVDIVVHSLTKYVGGHSDLLAGAVISSENIMREIFSTGYMLQGAVLSPFTAYFCLRGLRTLPVRLKEHEKNALIVAEFLDKHPKVKHVNHPALNKNEEDFFGPQLMGYTGVFSFILNSQHACCPKKLIDHLHYFRRGLSWGGFESMILAPYLSKNNEVCCQKHNEETCSHFSALDDHLIRVSIGLEPVEMLIEDLEQALEYVK